MDFKSFSSRWREQLSSIDTVWEGAFAQRELRRLGYYSHVRGEAHWQSRDLRKCIFKELEWYSSEVEAASSGKELSIREFRDALQLIQAIEKKLTRGVHRSHRPEVKKALLRLGNEMDATRRSLIHQEKELTYSSKSALRMREMLWPKNRKKQFHQRAIELDTTLQLQIAKILWTSMDDLSLPTVARLIVLSYLAAELAKEPEGGKCLLLINGGRTLTVKSVYDKLTYARIRANKPKLIR